MKRILPFQVMLSLICVVIQSNVPRNSIFADASYSRSLNQEQRQQQQPNDTSGQTEDTDETTATNTETTSQEEAAQSGLVDLVHLIPFDVQIAVTSNVGIQTYEVSNLVTEWLNGIYVEQLALFGYTAENLFAEFNSVVLFNNNNNDTNNNESRKRRLRRTQDSGALFVAKFRGGVVFSRDQYNRTRSVPENDVRVIQQTALLNNSGLIALLQRSTDATGLGNAVVDVKTFSSNPSSVSNTEDTTQGTDLDIVIIVAIVVACVAFIFLLGAIIWAYRFDRINREAYLVKDHTTNRHSANSNHHNTNDRTSESDTACDNDSPERIRAVVERGNDIVNIPFDSSKKSGYIYPVMIGGGDDIRDNDYPESVISDSVVDGSVISEDVSTSLSQYYRAGMGKADYGRNSGLLSDAGSVSSMESYGYSLDGGMSMAIPTEIPYKKERERIGGLPIEPDNLVMGDSNHYDSSMDDVQIPDLDKELSNLDIKLLPYIDHVDSETYSQQDLENYQMQDLEEMEQLSEKGTSLPMSVQSSSSSTRSAKISIQSDPVDLDDMEDSPDDEDADDTAVLPTLPATSVM
jgi:hypothetical protein